MIKNIFRILTLLALAVGLLPPAHAAQAAPAAGASPEAYINPDGTLNLDGSFSGSFDLSGWDVSLDPARGPVLLPIAEEGQWEAIGSGSGAITGDVRAIAVDGTDVYVGGNFQNADNIPAADFIARWDGSAWHSVGNEGVAGTDGSLAGLVNDIKVYSSGVIFIGGNFINVNNNGAEIATADYIAKWDGTAWSGANSNGAGNGALNGEVKAIFIDGTDVYTGGNFTDAGGIATADYIARYDADSDQWYTMGSDGASNGSFTGTVHAIAVNDTGVYVGGNFLDVNNNGTDLTAADYIVKWNWGSSSWSALGDNGAGNGSLSGPVYALAIKGSGALTQVYAGGAFYDVYSGTNVAIPGLHYLSYFDGSDWGMITAYPSPNGAVREILFTATDMYIAGDFTNLAGVNEADYIARYNTASFTWNALESNGLFDGSLTSHVLALAINGTRLYVGGDFYNINNNGAALPAASGIASWASGSGWSALGDKNGSINNSVHAIAVDGTDVYVGGRFDLIQENGQPVAGTNYIAKWDGSHWSALGGNGIGGSSLNGQVNVIKVSGSNVYVGGWFNNVTNGLTPVPNAAYLAKWDGTNWSAMVTTAAFNAPVLDIEIASNGDLYAGGYFTDTDSVAEADKIARFDGSNWHALGSSAGDGSLNSTVFAISLQGTNVYAGGGFTNVKDGVTTIEEADYIAKWDGTHWSALGNNGAGNGALNQSVLALAISGTTIYAGGNFTNAANIPNADYFAAWDGSAWSEVMGTVGAGSPAFTAAVYEILTFNDHVYAAGYFTNAAGIPAADYVARWNGTNWHSLKSDNAGDGSLNFYVSTLAAGATDIYIGGAFTNVKTNNATLNLADYLAVYGADVPPTVASITRASVNPTSAATVDFTVTFSESVTGVDLNDFTLTTTGVSAPTLSGLSGSGSSYTLTVNTGTGNGTIRLDLIATGTQIKDAIGHPVQEDYTSGEVYTVKRPVTLTSTAAVDGWILEASENSGQGGTVNSAATTFRVGDEAGDKQYRAMLSFNTSSLPDNAVIIKVTLKIKKQGLVGTNPFTILNGLTVDMRKPSFGALTLAPADFQFPAGRTAVAAFGTAPEPNWYSAILNASGKNYLNKTGITQFRLRFTLDDNDDGGADYMRFFSGNSAAGTRPQLIVEFKIP